jgi:hypothetical protein
MIYLKNFELFLITEDKSLEIAKLEDEKKKLEEQFDKKMNEFLGEYASELEDAEGIKAATDVLRKVIKKNGLIKTFKQMKGSLSLMIELSDLEKKIAKIKGEKYEPEVENILNTLKGALTPKNLAKIINGKTDELEIEYSKKLGGEASGEIKNVEILDDGSVEVSIDNDNVGIVKKDITEITGGADDEKSTSVDLVQSLKVIKSKYPKSILTFLQISKLYLDPVENKQSIENIENILGK